MTMENLIRMTRASLNIYSVVSTVSEKNGIIGNFEKMGHKSFKLRKGIPAAISDCFIVFFFLFVHAYGTFEFLKQTKIQ